MRSVKSTIKFAGILLCLFIIVQSCKHEPLPVPLSPASQIQNDTIPVYVHVPIYGSSGDTIKDSVCFNEDILPIIISNCAKSGCHVMGGYIPLTNYTQVEGVVSPGKPSQSLLYNVISTNYMPRNNTPLTQAQKDLIKEWINEGAKNNIDCGMSCDTTIYTYSGAVSPTIQNYCVGCHNGGSAGGNISLIGYSNVMVQVNNGKLWGAINHLTGFYAMPNGGPMLDECRITTIKEWIAAGAPDN
jgi:hypothetical protein